MSRFLIPLLLSSLSLAQEPINLNVVHRIRDEAFERSHVMDHIFYLSDVHGPRLTGTATFNEAAKWVVQRMNEYGISAHTESAGDTLRGWSLTRFDAYMSEPQFSRLIGVVMAGSGNTDGPVTGQPVFAPLVIDHDPDRYQAALDAYIARYRGKLRGKIVLASPPRKLDVSTAPEVTRYSDADLQRLALAPEPVDAARIEFPNGPAYLDYYLSLPRKVRIPIGLRNGALNLKRNRFFRDEGVSVVVLADSIGSGGTVFGSDTGLLRTDEPFPPPMIVLTPEHYNRMVRLTEHSIPVRATFDVHADSSAKPVEGFNVIAEIPGTKKKDEVVMIGGHLDSWTFGTGATDNGAGSAVMMEAMRILKRLNLSMDRTVRMGLWCSEEITHLGSRAYMRSHYGNEYTMDLKPDHAKLDVYFNFDSGSGKIRGIYLQNNDAARPIFQAWAPVFRDLGVTTVTIRSTGGSDHESFDLIGLPGFDFIQDPLNYYSRTHHSNMDVADYIEPADLMQAAAVVAAFAYQSATREQMFPRKPLPTPEEYNTAR